MKRRLVTSLLLGVVLICISLVHKTGSSNLEPMPLDGGCGHGGLCGVAVVPQSNINPDMGGPTLAKRGFPLAIVSLSADEDKPSNYYRGINVTGIILDYLLAVAVVFVLSSLVDGYKKKGSKSF